jgi:hypothetical protein
MESALNDALSSRMSDGSGKRVNDVLKTPMGPRNGLLELRNLVVIFDQSHFADDLGEAIISARVLGAAPVSEFSGELLLGVGGDGTALQIEIRQ